MKGFFTAAAVVTLMTASPAAAQAPAAKPATRSPAARPATAPDSGPTPAPAPAPRPEDVATLDAIVKALYASISGPAGEARDWNRFRSLFAPGARLIPLARPANGPVVPRALTPDDYVERSGPFLEKYGFTEREIARRVDRFGGIAQVFSTYEGKFQAPDAPGTPPRGINSIQLAYDGSRWWVVTVFWDSERADNPIPETYLRSREDGTR